MNRSISDSGIPTVEIYTWRFCPFCLRAKALLNEKGVKFKEYSIDGDDDARTKMSERAGGLRTVPQIFVNDHHVGGFNELNNLVQKGELDSLLLNE